MAMAHGGVTALVKLNTTQANKAATCAHRVMIRRITAHITDGSAALGKDQFDIAAIITCARSAMTILLAALSVVVTGAPLYLSDVI